MKQLKAMRYVTFGSNLYSNDEAVHRRELKIAEKLEGTKFSDAVASLELGTSEDGSYSSHTYYKQDGLMVTDAEYQQLREIGVKDLRVMGIYETELFPMSQAFVISAWLLFVAWNTVLICKVGGWL